MKTYGYARVSSTEQNEERQVAALNTETYARPDFTGAKPPVPIEKPLRHRQRFKSYFTVFIVRIPRFTSWKSSPRPMPARMKRRLMREAL